LQLRLTGQQQPETPRTVCGLKIRYTPGPFALSCLSAEGLALRRLFRSGGPSYGPFGHLVRTAREHVRPIARSNDRPDAARKRAIWTQQAHGILSGRHTYIQRRVKINNKPAGYQKTTINNVIVAQMQ
jgi:hypothetical protein